MALRLSSGACLSVLLLSAGFRACAALGLQQQLREAPKRSGVPNNIYFVHIPRTAGTSFIADAKKSLNTIRNSMLLKYELGAQEGCYDWLTEYSEPPKVAMMMRSPRSHVFSQYLMCGEGPINLMTTVPSPEKDGFAQWLYQWRRILKEGNGVGDFSRGLPKKIQLKTKLLVTYTDLPFHCYNPANMQSHRLTCDLPFKYPDQIDGKRAVENMRKAWFVGIAERYHESICLFHAKVYNNLPRHCNCTDSKKWNSFSPSHISYHDDKLRSGPLEDQQDWVLEMVDNMTELDRTLYDASTRRFEKEVREVEARLGANIMCGEPPRVLPKITKQREDEMQKKKLAEMERRRREQDESLIISKMSQYKAYEGKHKGATLAELLEED